VSVSGRMTSTDDVRCAVYTAVLLFSGTHWSASVNNNIISDKWRPTLIKSRAGGVDVFIAPEEEELEEEEEDNPLASCLPDTFTIRKSSQVPVTSTASHTAETSIPESQSVRSGVHQSCPRSVQLNMSRSSLAVADILLPSLLQLESRVKARAEVTQGH